MKKEKLDLENAYANDDICTVCIACVVAPPFLLFLGVYVVEE